MIWNLILYIKKVYKQNTCIHDYKIVIRKDTGGSFDKCEKCGRLN